MPRLRRRPGRMVPSRRAAVIQLFSLATFEREMTLLILLSTATPTGGIPTEFAGPQGAMPQKRFHRFAEVLHQVETMDDLHCAGSPLANAIRRQGSAIATDDGDRRRPGEPGRDTGGGSGPAGGPRPDAL
jgi:hypothetical protein